jgi:hypothetical protein
MGSAGCPKPATRKSALSPLPSTPAAGARRGRCHRTRYETGQPAPLLLTGLVAVALLGPLLAAAGALIAIDKAETGTPVPYIPPTEAAAVIGSVAVLATATIMASLYAMPGRRG